MGGYPDFLEPRRHRDAEGRLLRPWLRRLGVAALGGIATLALLNVFGQRATTSRAGGPAAGLEVRGPTKVRSGLLFQQRVTVRAARAIEHPRLVLAEGWVDGLQLNTIAPQPVSESSRDGSLVLGYDGLAAGDVLRVHLQFQANPTSVGRSDLSIELDDATTPLVALRRTLTTYP